jgi:3-oxoacyl-[acyl-carrier protein] reductase
LFNSIGMEDVQGTLLVDMPLQDFMHPIITAATTQFLTARTVGRRMVEKRSGVILTITAGPPAIAYIGGFGPACGVIAGLWRGFAAELGPSGVRVICLRSAGIARYTGRSADVQGARQGHGRPVGGFPRPSSSGTLLKRLPTSAEVANVATIMASDRAGAMTGTFVSVTCGSRGE